MDEPLWLIEARKYIGLTEVKGEKTNPEIAKFWKDIKRGGIKDDETPWCAAFTGAMLERVGITSSRSESSQSYMTWGVPLNQPVTGCVVVFKRPGGGHVGFVVGRDAKGNILVLAGNQGDAVNIRAFAPNNPKLTVIGYRWPVGVPVPKEALQTFASVQTTEKVT